MSADTVEINASPREFIGFVNALESAVRQVRAVLPRKVFYGEGMAEVTAAELDRVLATFGELRDEVAAAIARGTE